MAFDDKQQILSRALAGGALGITGCLLLGFVSQPGGLFGAPLTWDFTFCYNSRVPESLGTALAFLLWFLFGAEVGIATLPFADSGRELVARSLVHFAVTAATVSAWAVLNFGVVNLSFFLLPLTLVYVLVWLGRWVGWFAEVAAIREKLGLPPGPSLFHWRESLPYVGFAFLLCLVLPMALGFFEAVDAPVLGIFYTFLLLSIGGLMSGLSLGRRHGFCPLYPAACAVFIGIFILTAPPIDGGILLAVAVTASLAGNLAGAVRYKMKRKARNHHEKTDPSL